MFLFRRTLVSHSTTMTFCLAAAPVIGMLTVSSRVRSSHGDSLKNTHMQVLPVSIPHSGQSFSCLGLSKFAALNSCPPLARSVLYVRVVSAAPPSLAFQIFTSETEGVHCLLVRTASATSLSGSGLNLKGQWVSQLTKTT